MTSVTDPKVNGARPVTQYQYDLLDQIKQVTDPRSLNTIYNKDGLGNLASLNSPDTGTTNNTVYDAAGNLKTTIDARGVTANYTYDALNRPTQVIYSGGGFATVTVTYGYDGGTF